MELLSNLSAYDWIVILAAVFSMLVGLMRGMITELVSFGSWFGALLLARLGAEPLGKFFEHTMENSALRLGLAFILIFFVALISIRLIGRALSKVASRVGLGFLDRFLGAVFGLVRAIAILMVLVVFAALTGLNDQADWKRAWFTIPLERLTALALPLLPKAVAVRVHLHYDSHVSTPIRFVKEA
jgi:membrane protein required for colicin V production